MVDWTERRVVGQEAMDLADGAATEMLVMMDDEHILMRRSNGAKREWWNCSSLREGI